MAKYSIIFLCLLASCGIEGEATDDKNLPFYFPKYRPEVFYDNKVVPEDVEVSVFVFKAQTQRVYFLLEKEGRPISFTITPCSEPIKWRLLFRNFPLHGRKDSWHNKVPESSEDDKITPIATYNGRDRKIYTKSRTSAGLYVLEFESKESDTRVRIYITTRPELNGYYPQLPTDFRVSILKVRRNRILITWKASPTESRLGQMVSYCVSLNQIRNQRSMCSANSHLQGDTPPTHPPSAGFGFAWEKTTWKSTSKQTEKSASDRVSITCVGRKTWHMFRGLHRGATYYIDVFVVNSQTNASSVYTGVEVTTKQSRSASRLRDNSLTTFVLDAKNTYSFSVKYSVPSSTKQLWIFLQSCTGPGPITLKVTKDDREIVSSNVMDTKTLSIVPPSNGTYQITVKTTTENPRKARMWIGKKYHKLPFPVLPEDKSIKVFDTLTTCDSVTLAWHSTVEEKVRYCIYKRTAKAGFMRLFASPQNFCEQSESNKDDRERILCRRYHRFSRQRFNNVIMQRIRGLLPSHTYIFDVQVTKPKAKTLSYEQVWITTANNCSLSKRKR